MARGPQPVRAPRPHDSRHLGVRAAGRREPPGAGDVECVRPDAAHPRRRAAPPDRAPALRGQRHLPGSLRAPEQFVSAQGGRSMKGFGTTFAALGLAISAVAFAHAQQNSANDLLRGLADPSRWLTYSGDYASTRHSPLTQITPENVARLAPVWTFDSGLGAGRRDKFEATPIVIDGTMYVTGLYNHAWAIDGRTGTVIWHYQRKLPIDLRVCCGLVNRGF